MEHTFYLCYASIIKHITACQIFILLYFLCYLEVLYFLAHGFNTCTQEKHFTILTWINLIKFVHLIKHCRCNVIRRMKQRFDLKNAITVAAAFMFQGLQSFLWKSN